MEIQTIEGEREQGAFNNPIVKWRYKIAINNRSSWLVSETMYSSRLKAENAGLRIIKQLSVKAGVDKPQAKCPQPRS